MARLLRLHFFCTLSLAFSWEESECSGSSCGAQFLQFQAEARSAQNPWPHARGNPSRGSAASGVTPEAWTSHTLAWTWHDPKGKYHNLFAGGPVIDQDKNFYQTTAKGIYAINSAGQEIWHYEPSGRSNNEVTLAGDLVLGTSINGTAFAVNRLSGKEVWASKLAETAGGDCGYPGASNGVFVAAADMPPPPSGGGNLRVFGLDVKNGTKMWEYDPDMPLGLAHAIHLVLRFLRLDIQRNTEAIKGGI